MSLPLLFLFGLGGDELAPAAPPPGPLLVPARDEGAPRLGLLLRPFLTFSASEGGLGSEDIAGQVFEDLDVWAAQTAGPFAWRLQAEFEDGEPVLEDAWARCVLAGEAALRVGQFKPRVVRSASIAEDGLLFRSRTFLGSAFESWDDGAELATSGERWSASLALTDGANGSESDHFWSLRGEWELYESDLVEKEGARGAENFLVSRLGVATFADVSQSSEDGGGLAFDLALTYGPYSIAVEWAHLQDEFSREVDVFNGHVFDLGDGDPLAFTFGRTVGDELEAAIRYERAEDADDTTATRLALNWGRPGALARFLGEVGLVEAESRDFTLLSFGVVMGSSGQLATQ
jgi:hypothetical protein